MSMPGSDDDPVRQALLECLAQEKLEGELGVGKVHSIRVVGEKTCPFCAERIKDTARICPHCRSILDPSLEKKDFWWFAGQLIGRLFAIAFIGSIAFVATVLLMFLLKR